MARRWRLVVLSVLLLIAVVPAIATADHTTDPISVAVVGDLQSELGCPGDWQPECVSTELAYDPADDVWQATFSIPAGAWEFKAALNDSFTENYGAGGIADGPNIALDLAAETEVKFYYDHGTHWVTDNENSVIATAAGTFQSEIGCPGDWQPECLRSWLQDPDGDAVYDFATTAIPAGSYEFKVALDELWDTSYPGPNVPFTVTADGELVTISFDSGTNDVGVTVEPAPLDPSSVTIAGSLQDELGCPGDWQPDCSNTHLAYDPADDVWQAEFDLPAGSFEYKAALRDSWDENYGAGAVLDGPNIALNLAAPTTVKFYYDHGTHWVTDNENSVIATAAGSFQAAIGCPGDWQPECLRSWLQDPDGDSLYEYATTAIPAGSYEFKVALDERWDTSYPGLNVPFTVAADDDLITFTYNATTNEVAVDTGEPTIEPGDELLVREPIRIPAQDEVLYFVMPDRFEDGDPGNNTGGIAGDPRINGFLPTDGRFFHGGDLAGLQAKLDYIEGLGVTAIWMTPQFKQAWVPGPDIANTWPSYHGYHQIDFSQIDPHWGTNAEMATFIADAQGRGIKVYFDIVANHTGDVLTNVEGDGLAYVNKTTSPFRDADGAPFDDLDYAGTGNFPALDPAVSFPYTPAFRNAGDETIKSPAWLNDPTLYHNRGQSTFAGESSLYGDFFGLDDLFTSHPTVQDGLIDIFKGMVTDFGIDGFRIDTVKHVNDEFWQAFSAELETHAAAEGKTEFFMFGEVFSGDPEFSSRYTTELGLPAVLDFGFQGAARSFASQSNATDQLQTLFANDDWYTDADSNAYSLPTFLGNHDQGRIGAFIGQDNGGAVDSEMLARDQLAHALMYFGRGIPVVYYGDEQGFTGDLTSPGDWRARQDMMPSQVASYNAEDLIGTTATTADANFDETHPLYLTLADYSVTVAAHPALSRGAQLHRYSEGSAGIYAFSRIDRDELVEYLVVLNNSEASDSATFGTDSPSTGFTEVWPGGGPAISADAGGDVTVAVPALAFAIYRADAPIATSASAPAVTLTSPVEGAEVLGRVEVGATLSRDTYAEVTFAVSIGGGTYEPIGTDDNAPYRVFYDVSEIPAGTPLVFKAIVADAAGNLASAKGGAVVGEEEPPPTGPESNYAVIHYFRTDGDYGDPTTGEFNDYWGLHLWGEAIDPGEGTEWAHPKPFLGEDDYGRFAWVELADNAQVVNFIVHRGDTKDGTDADRSFNPAATPEIWLRQDDATTYESQAAAQGFVTIRYHRDDGDYGDPTSPDYNDYWGLHLWGDAIDPGEGTEWANSKPFDGVDDYGAYWNVLVQDVTQPVNFIIHRGDTKDVDPDESFVPEAQATVWRQSGDVTHYETRGAAENFLRLHYHRPAGDYGDPTSPDYNDFWGMHTWGDADDPGWATPRTPVGFDTFGAIFEVPLHEDPVQVGYLLHRGDEKDPGPDQSLELAVWGNEVWQQQGADVDSPYILPILAAGAAPGDLAKQQAYWVGENRIAWAPAGDPIADYRLYYAPDGGLVLEDGTITGGAYVELAPAAPFPTDVEGFRHLAGLPQLQFANAADLALVPEILKGEMAVIATNRGVRVDATGLQIQGVLDDLYTFTGDLGVVWDDAAPAINLWAPTAKTVTFHLFDDADPATTSAATPMTLDPTTGVWTITGDATWSGKYYLYEVEVYAPATGAVEHNMVTDPYSLSLAMNSTRTQIVHLDDPALAPGAWVDTPKPPIANPEDITLYELHIRDFSANDLTVPADYVGTYKAFTLETSDGMNHLGDLADAGLTHVHLLPAFDIATINENKAEWQAPDPALLGTYPPDSEQQQAAVTATENLDGFNWGYDPFHYTTPEGSYSTNPDGPTRILEFREMVQSLNQTGLRVVMDVVYNHTNSSGQSDTSVLDRIVPGYYHRLNADGVVETSTCCANTATEYAMMEKLMVDSVVTWARDHKVDGFRFDLMGHHSLANMQAVRAALDALTVADDGVDGSAIYLYGEGWNFGEVADDARFIQATQLNLGGSGIGSFSDRLRDAVRGGGPFDGGDDLARRQGFINGLFYDYNTYNSGAAGELDTLLLNQDQIRVGLAGNLAAYEFIDRNGNLVIGAEVDYNGAPAGYTADPQENIIYVSAHDNQTLFDISQYKHPLGVSTADRARAQNVGIDVTLLAQGVPFLHAGVDLLRSKSLDRDSYNSGDWFNKLDFTYQDNNWGVGLPVAGKNQDNWYLMQPLLADPALVPSPADIAATAVHTQEMLAIRDSSDLFRLTTAAEVEDRVGFHNTGPDQLPGLIVMSISDTVGDDLDDEADAVWSLINANDEAQSFTVGDLTGAEVVLHPVQATSADPIVRTAAFDDATGTFTVPGRTTAVFVQLEPDMTPPEVVAELVPLKVNLRTGRFQVWYSCTDDRDPNPVSNAELNGIPVEVGTRVFLITHPDRNDHRWVNGQLFVWGQEFALTVTCTDEAGNTTVEIVEPEFATAPPQ